MSSIWDDLGIDPDLQPQLTAESDQATAGARQGIEAAVREHIASVNRGVDIPEVVYALAFKAADVNRAIADGADVEELVFNLCLLVAVAIFKLAEVELPREELPPI